MIIHGNNQEELPKLQSNSVDLCITSPPYKTSDGYNEENLKFVFSQCYRILKDNTLFFLNFGHLAEDKFRPFATCKLAMDIGFNLNDTITWVKNHYKPIQGNRRLNNLSEFIFILYKGKMPLLNRLSIGIPYADKSNVNRFNGGLDLKCGGNIWYIDYETINKVEDKGHNDRYPIELPEKCIKLCGYDVNTILDPYSGSGTTGIACKSLNKEYIGIECSDVHYEHSITRINNYNKPK